MAQTEWKVPAAGIPSSQANSADKKAADKQARDLQAGGSANKEGNTANTAKNTYSRPGNGNIQNNTINQNARYGERRTRTAQNQIRSGYSVSAAGNQNVSRSGNGVGGSSSDINEIKSEVMTANDTSSQGITTSLAAPGGGTLGFLFEDTERTLLILLIILLSEEGADAGLIMALMYCAM